MSSSAATRRHGSDRNSGNSHRNSQISDHRHLFSVGHFTQGTSVPPSQDPIQANVNGSSSSAQYFEPPFNTNHPVLPATYYSAGRTPGSYVYSQQASDLCPNNSHHVDLYQQGYNSLPYSMERWLSQGRYGDPYHAFVTDERCPPDLGMIIAEDSAHEQGETVATWGSNCDNTRRST
ncbi:hypothetical protein HD806DRAFT_538987 [Xylariaceae sp. AK1471]|nr:hypothetical protein HD806DRAFT_538987 [Xylariaceae sp. AK1471]